MYSPSNLFLWIVSPCCDRTLVPSLNSNLLTSPTLTIIMSVQPRTDMTDTPPPSVRIQSPLSSPDTRLEIRRLTRKTAKIPFLLLSTLPPYISGIICSTLLMVYLKGLLIRLVGGTIFVQWAHGDKRIILVGISIYWLLQFPTSIHHKVTIHTSVPVQSPTTMFLVQSFPDTEGTHPHISRSLIRTFPIHQQIRTYGGEGKVSIHILY